MPTTKHTATAPNGQVFTRTSKSKVYSHVTIGQYCKARALRNANSSTSQEQDGKNWDFHLEQAEGRWTCASYQRDPAWAATRIQRDIEEGKAWIAANPDRATYIAKLHQDRVAKVEATDFTKWHDLGWSSRQDLAEKNASTYRDRLAVVTIVPAVTA